MENFSLFLKAHWNDILTALIAISILIKSAVLQFIHLCDKHEGFINLITGLLTAVIACMALSTWKKELKAKKLYDLHYRSYNFLQDLQTNLNNLTQLYREYDECCEEGFNEEIASYFRNKIGELQELELNLSIVDSKDKTLKYFGEQFKKYSEKESDRYLGQIQSRINPETGEVEDYDPYCCNFYNDYFATNKMGKFDVFHHEFDKKVQKSIKHFNDKVKKFF